MQHTGASLTLDSASYSGDDAMVVSFSVPSDAASSTDWLGITERGQDPPSEYWQYLCGGQSACSEPQLNGSVSFTLLDGLSSSGEYDITLFANNGYTVLAGPVPFSYTLFCPAATIEASAVTHAVPVEHSPLSRVAFSSCYKPSRQTSSTLWEHMRDSGSELWLWLGDNQVLANSHNVDVVLSVMLNAVM
jgi:hypothetical protein